MSAATAPHIRTPPTGATRNRVVGLIRALDRRGGIASRRGVATYGRLVGLFAGLHRAVEEETVAAVGDREWTVVDVGAGPGDLLAALVTRLPRATLVGVEPSPEMPDLAALRGVTELAGLAERLPLEDGSIDLVVSTLSAHHWDDPVAAFRELRRVLRPGGEARIYDVRFAGYGRGEAEAIGVSSGLPTESIEHRILPQRILGLRPYAVIALKP